MTGALCFIMFWLFTMSVSSLWPPPVAAQESAQETAWGRSVASVQRWVGPPTGDSVRVARTSVDATARALIATDRLRRSRASATAVRCVAIASAALQAGRVPRRRGHHTVAAVVAVGVATGVDERGAGRTSAREVLAHGAQQ
jgi:hypothetical protein